MADQAITLFSSMTQSNNGVPWVFPITSDKAKGCGYYGQNNGLHTVQYSTTGGFVGRIDIQATLATDPAEEDWFVVDNVGLGDSVTPLPDQSVLNNFDGNFVWVRAIITAFTAGYINRVQFTHN